MNKTNIEYLDYSWNPLAMRCTPVSEGCVHCWHITMADRLKNNPKMPAGRRDSYSGGPPVLIEDELAAPVKLKKPSVIGVQFMGDLFHEDVPYKWIERIFGEMWDARQHTYLILTKRPHRMKKFISDYQEGLIPLTAWPNEYDHVYLGVTAENQQRADERIPILLQIPAAKHFVSIEPMLGPVSLRSPPARGRGFRQWDQIHKLDWIIVGGESGPGARPMHPDWPRSVRDQCQEAGVPFFFKQWGEHCYPEQMPEDTFREADAYHGHGLDYNAPYKVGKKKAGRLLDGREWTEVPE
jgi:protein gp37